ncbi:MAG: type III pantothenate kinase [Thermaurantimonas sp.]
MIKKNYLLADIGNSNTKIEVHTNEGTRLYKFSSLTPEGDFPATSWREIIDTHHIETLLISSVIPGMDAQIRSLSAIGRLILVCPDLYLPFEILYKTPYTLGTDRICLAAAAVSAPGWDPSTASLIISAGTCITFDVLVGRKYLGGSISPGIHMRAKAMHAFTNALPLIHPANHQPACTDLPIIGQTTEECLLAGSLQGAVFEINEYITRLSEKYKNLNIYLTGGDTSTLEKLIKSDIFARPNMCLEGLNILYRLNA